MSKGGETSWAQQPRGPALVWLTALCPSSWPWVPGARDSLGMLRQTTSPSQRGVEVPVPAATAGDTVASECQEQQPHQGTLGMKVPGDWRGVSSRPTPGTV